MRELTIRVSLGRSRQHADVLSTPRARSGPLRNKNDDWLSGRRHTPEDQTSPPNAFGRRRVNTPFKGDHLLPRHWLRSGRDMPDTPGDLPPIDDLSKALDELRFVGLPK